MRFKPTLWPTLVTIPMLAVLVGLGLWQLDRLDWKAARITERQVAAAAASMALPSAAQMPTDDLLYRPVRVTGRYIHGDEMYLLNRVRDSRPGVHVVTPLIRSDNGTVLLVDRGWAPFDWPDAGPHLEASEPVEVTVTGIVRPAPPPGWLVPDNRPLENQWYFIDLAAMARTAGVPSLTDYYLFATEEIPVGATPNAGDDGPAWPVANEWRVDLPNNHLSYAITWFALAGVLLLIYLAYHIGRSEE